MPTPTTTSNLVPTIDSAALPKTPAGEWADSTHEILSAHSVATPSEAPGPNVPGSFPDEYVPPDTAAGGNSTTTSGGGTSIIDTARAYLPAQEDIQRVMASAGQTAMAYLPQGVAAYLPSESDADKQMTPPRPPFVNEDSAMRKLSTEAQAGSLHPPLGDSLSTLSVDQDSSLSADDAHSIAAESNLSTAVHTGRASSPHPVAPLSNPLTSASASSSTSKFVEDLATPPHVTSPSPLSPPASDSLATPALVSSPDALPSSEGFSSTSQSEGVPAPPNSLATTFDSPPAASVNNSPPPVPSKDTPSPSPSPPAPHPHSPFAAVAKSVNVPQSAAVLDSITSSSDSPSASASPLAPNPPSRFAAISPSAPLSDFASDSPSAISATSDFNANSVSAGAGAGAGAGPDAGPPPAPHGVLSPSAASSVRSNDNAPTPNILGTGTPVDVHSTSDPKADVPAEVGAGVSPPTTSATSASASSIPPASNPDSGSGSGSEESDDAGADGATKERRDKKAKKPKLVQRLKEKLHVVSEA